MRQSLRFAVGVVAGLAALTLCPFAAEQRPVIAQGAQRAPFEAQFWVYLKQVHYRNWAPGTGKGAGHYPGKSPHGAFLKSYVNRIAAADSKNLPHGSIIIKENFDKAKKLQSLTVMYRTKGFDPEHNDWYWLKYKPDGTIETDKDGKPIAGRYKACIDCHATAKGGDYYYSNDK